MKLLSVTVASLAGACVSSAVLADTVMFDIPSGYHNDVDWTSYQNAKQDSILVDSEHIAFKENGFAFEGAVRAWDHASGSNEKGKIFFDAAEGWLMTGLAFDISGFKEFESTVRLKVVIDGTVFKDKTWSFSGNDDFMSKDWDFGSGVSNVKVVIENLNGSPYIGLDNIAFSTVPAPGALALLGVAGIAGGRRRRSA